MSDNKLEQQFREKIDGHISPIDSDALWNDIQRKRPKKDSFGMIRVFLSLLAGLLLVGGMYCYFSNTQNNAASKSTTITDLKENSITNSNLDSSANTKNNFNKKVNSASAKVKTIELSKSQESELVQAIEKTELPNQISTSKSDSDIKSNEIHQGESIDMNSNSFRFNSQPNSNTIQKNETYLKSNGINFNKTVPQLNKSNLKATKDEEKKAPLVENLEQIKNEIDPSSIAENSAWLTDQIGLLELNLLKFKIKQPSLKAIPIKPNRGRNRFEIGASFNYEYAFRNLNSLASDSTQFGSTYANLRNDAEEFIESYRAGLFLRYAFKPNFRASLGLEYAQLTERFETNTFVGSGFRNDISTNFSPVIVDSVRVRKIHNRYSSINIPINIGKTFGHKRLSYFIDMGALINISFESSGQIFSDSEMSPNFLNLENISEADDGELFKVSYTIHTGLRYQLNTKTNLELGPQFHSSFQPESRINFIETERYYLSMRLNILRRF